MWARISGSTVRPAFFRCLTASPSWAVFQLNDDGGEQVEPGHAVVLALAGAVADFALAPDAECVLERVMSPALVRAGVGPALHIGVEQPVDDEERAFDPSDFAESDGQFVLARIGRELFIPAGAALSVRGSSSGRPSRPPQPPPNRCQERLI